MSKLFYPSARAVINVKLGAPNESSIDIPSTVIWTLPQSCTIHRNKASQADSFELTFDERDCPFDPSSLLAGEVSIYLYNAPSLLEKDRLFNRSEIVENKTNGSRQDQLELRKSQFTFDSEPTIVGLIDEIRSDKGSDGRFITIQGQDYTALLLEKQWPPSRGNRPRRIPTGRKLDETISGMLREVDPGGALSLKLRGVKSEDLPVVKDIGINKGKTGIPVESGTKYWDVMHKTATRSGFMLYVEGLDVVLEKPRSELASEARRQIHMAWGANIENISVSRKLGIEKTPALLMTAYDPKTRKQVEVIYPENANKKSGEYVTIPIDRVVDAKSLRNMVRLAYSDMGRAQRAITMSTRDLADLDGQNILDLRSGDAVRVTFDDYNRETLSSAQLTNAAKHKFLTDRGFSADASSAIIANYSKLQAFDKPLFLREVSFKYDSSSGIGVEMELVDFVIFGESVKSERSDGNHGRLGIGSTKAHEAEILK